MIEIFQPSSFILFRRSSPGNTSFGSPVLSKKNCTSVIWLVAQESVFLSLSISRCRSSTPYSSIRVKLIRHRKVVNLGTSAPHAIFCKMADVSMRPPETSSSIRWGMASRSRSNCPDVMLISLRIIVWSNPDRRIVGAHLGSQSRSKPVWKTNSQSFGRTRLWRQVASASAAKKFKLREVRSCSRG